VAIPIQCPECHKKYQAPDHMAGKRVKCKHCGVVFLIAADARSADAGADMSALDELNALGETGKRDAQKGGGAAAATGGEDIDSLFRCEYPSEGAPRTNKLYLFPMSRLLDHWLPPVLLAIGLVWATREAFFRNDTGRPWVGAFRAAVFVVAFFASVFPFTLMGMRSASCRLNFELPPRPGLRIMGTYAVPFALAWAMWLVLGGTSGLMVGVLIGCVVALPVLFLLFRLLPSEAPVTFGYATGSFLISIVVSAAAVFALNLMLVGVLRSVKSDQTLAVSPFGPGFKWDAPAPVKKHLAQIVPEPDVAPTTDPSDTQPATGPTTEPHASTTGPAAPPAGEAGPDAPAVALVPPAHDVVRPEPGPSVPAAPPRRENGAGEKAPPKGSVVAGDVPAGLVVEDRVVIPGAFKQVVYPAVPGTRVAVVREGRPGHDHVEAWDNKTWKKAAELEVPRSPEGNRYSLSPDGEYLCYLTDFPRLAAQVWSLSQGRLHRQIDLESADGEPHALGFVSADQLLLRRDRGGDVLLQEWNVKAAGRPRQFAVADFDVNPSRYAIAPDGSAIAFIVANGSGADLESYSLTTGRPVKQMPIVEVNWNNNVTVAGMAYTPDAQRVCAVFAGGQGAGFFVAWPAAGRSGRPLLQQLLPVGVNVPPQVGGMPARFEGRGMHWLDNGRAWALFGASVFDTDTGTLLGSLNQANVRGQSTRPDGDRCQLVHPDEFGGVHLFEEKLDLAGARKRLIPADASKGN